MCRVDGIWLALKRATTPASHPAFHYFEPAERDLVLGAEALYGRHIETAVAVSNALDMTVAHYLATGHRAVVEGAWITPEFASRRAFGLVEAGRGVRAIFIHEHDEAEVLSAMQDRRNGGRPGTLPPTPRQLIITRVCWLYGNWIRDEASRLGLPVVAARPRDTLVDRIIEAAR